MKLEGEPKVLLVEDVAALQQLVSVILNRSGAHVTIAENGLIGVEKAREGQFDVVLMDMQMPVMDGYTAVSTLRSEGITTPVLAMTAHATNEDKEKCLKAGCSGYLSKPIKPERLLTAIAELMSSSPGDETISEQEVARVKAPNDLEGPQAAPIDREDLLERVLHDVELLECVFDVFFDDYPQLFARVGEAIQASDPDGLMKSAHTLKSALVNLSASHAHHTAHCLEQLGANGSTDDAQRLADRLGHQIEELRTAYLALACSLRRDEAETSVAE